MAKTRLEKWLTLVALGAGLLLAGFLGLWAYMRATPPLYSSAREVPSVAQLTVAPRWAGAVEQGREVVRAALAERSLPGVSVAVGAGGEIVWAEGFGYADLEHRVPVAPDGRFRIGTASIALTSAAVGVLVEKGRLELDESIRRHVPEFPEQHGPVTLQQLMGHVAGIRNDGGDEGPLFGTQCQRTVDGLEPFKESRLLFEPGTGHRFSSFGWILVSAAVEAAAGEPFFSFIRRQVLEPLGMHDTRPDSAAEPIANRVTFYFPRFAADPRYGLHLTRPIDLSCYAGAGAFLSTASDLVRFGLAVNGGALLQPSTVQRLQAPQRLASGQETGYGLGWDLGTVELAGKQTRWVGHHGTSLGGMVASLMTFPDRELVVVVLSNIAWADTESIGLDVAQAFARQATPGRRPR